MSSSSAESSDVINAVATADQENGSKKQAVKTPRVRGPRAATSVVAAAQAVVAAVVVEAPIVVAKVSSNCRVSKSSSHRPTATAALIRTPEVMSDLIAHNANASMTIKSQKFAAVTVPLNIVAGYGSASLPQDRELVVDGAKGLSLGTRQYVVVKQRSQKGQRSTLVEARHWNLLRDSVQEHNQSLWKEDALDTKIDA